MRPDRLVMDLSESLMDCLSQSHGLFLMDFFRLSVVNSAPVASVLDDTDNAFKELISEHLTDSGNTIAERIYYMAQQVRTQPTKKEVIQSWSRFQLDQLIEKVCLFPKPKYDSASVINIGILPLIRRKRPRKESSALLTFLFSKKSVNFVLRRARKESSELEPNRPRRRSYSLGPASNLTKQLKRFVYFQSLNMIVQALSTSGFYH
jgi:hypothetical protein